MGISGQTNIWRNKWRRRKLVEENKNNLAEKTRTEDIPELWRSSNMNLERLGIQIGGEKKKIDV